MGTELVGDRLSRGTNQLGTNCGGPNVRGPYTFETKCVQPSLVLTQKIFTAMYHGMIRVSKLFTVCNVKITFLPIHFTFLLF